MLTVGVLGPLDVRRDGRPLTVPSGRTTELLVRLALEAGRVVSTERLIEDLWGDAAAGDRPEHVAVQGVPAAPGARRAGPAEQRRTAATASRLKPEQVDALRVVALAAAAGAARRAGDPAAALRRRGGALGAVPW